MDFDKIHEWGIMVTTSFSLLCASIYPFIYAVVSRPSTMAEIHRRGFSEVCGKDDFTHNSHHTREYGDGETQSVETNVIGAYQIPAMTEDVSV